MGVIDPLAFVDRESIITMDESLSPATPGRSVLKRNEPLNSSRINQSLKQNGPLNVKNIKQSGEPETKQSAEIEKYPSVPEKKRVANKQRFWKSS